MKAIGGIAILILVLISTAGCKSQGGSEKSTSTAPPAPAADCDYAGLKDSETQKKLFYSSQTVPFGSTCDGKERSRTCNNGVVSDWTTLAGYTFETCQVLQPKTCDGFAHDSKQTRTTFESISVPYGSSCKSEVQTRTCNNGTWSAWTGTYQNLACSVGTPASCGTTAHGTVKTQVRYAASSVPYGSTCQQETQSSTCINGNWSAWTGTFTATSCSVAAPLACDGSPHGTTQQRKKYYSSTTTPSVGGACYQETQSRTCNNGTWSAWTGTYTFDSCTVKRIKYSVASGAVGSTCPFETQSSTCTAGTCAAWTGTYTYDTCTESRIKYAAAQVPFSSTCSSQTQTRTCTGGTCGLFSGTYTYDTCVKLTAQDCGVVKHNSFVDIYNTPTATFPPNYCWGNQAKCFDGKLAYENNFNLYCIDWECFSCGTDSRCEIKEPYYFECKQGTISDSDADGILNSSDSCPNLYNPTQTWYCDENYRSAGLWTTVF